MRKPSEFVTIALTFNDGSVGVMRFITAEFNRADEQTFERVASSDEVVKEIMKTRWPAEKKGVKSWRPIAPEDVSADYTYRNAWRDSGDAITHDMDAVRAIALARVRKEREPEFAALDAEWMKATGQRDTAEAERIEADRQALRDKPALVLDAIKDATSVAEVKAALETFEPPTAERAEVAPKG